MEKIELYAFMTRFRYGVVSSVSMQGVPQSALVGIATTSELEIVFDTVQTSRKYSNLVRQPACSFVVGWGGEQTIQLEGIATQPTGDELKRFQEIYFTIWRDGPERLGWPGIAYFVVRPRWVRFSDFDENPPLIVEWKLTD